MTNYNGVTHPSEPNYVAASECLLASSSADIRLILITLVAGDFFGMGDDNNYYLPANVSSMVDLLEAKNISWASYRQSLSHESAASKSH